MSFRERPEYQGWRDAVLQLFGQKCIRCGYTGNLHAHHVMPVNEYPELALEPTNGVPLCGNCHSEVNGDELAHVDDLKRRQDAILVPETAGVSKDDPSGAALRERAYAEPSNSQAVQAWFGVANAHAVVDFYDHYHEASTQTEWLCGYVASCLRATARWEDLVAVCDKAMEISEREGTLEGSVEKIASIKRTAMYRLGQHSEAVAFLRRLVARFPASAVLHGNLSGSLLDVFSRLPPPPPGRKNSAEGKDLLDQAATHALDAARLAPRVADFASRASFVLTIKGDYPAALRYGKRAYTLASTREDKIDALQQIAGAYEGNELFADARGYLREALHIDADNVHVIADLAHCFFMEGNVNEAVQTARRGLMLDPSNKLCQQTVRLCGSA
jgi:tetratricopeptide (TPR) repeat protein